MPAETDRMPADTAAESVAPVLPRLERPSRELVLEFATRLFVNNERVDMGILAAALGVGRSTLYRWVGDREQLIADVLAQLTDVGWRLAADGALGAGAERATSTAARFIEISTGFTPLRKFSRTEPALALRLLLAPDSLVNARVRCGLRRTLDENLPGVPIPDEIVDAAVQVGAALGWAPIVIGDEPAVDRAVTLARALIRTSLPDPR